MVVHCWISTMVNVFVLRIMRSRHLPQGFDDIEPDGGCQRIQGLSHAIPAPFVTEAIFALSRYLACQNMSFLS
jgi:hypothetical protein